MLNEVVLPLSVRWKDPFWDEDVFLFLFPQTSTPGSPAGPVVPGAPTPPADPSPPCGPGAPGFPGGPW